jgi:hypothetical protein
MIKSLYACTTYNNNNNIIYLSLSLMLFLRPAVLQNRHGIIFTLMHRRFVTRDTCFVHCSDTTNSFKLKSFAGSLRACRPPSPSPSPAAARTRPRLPLRALALSLSPTVRLL